MIPLLVLVLAMQLAPADPAAPEALLDSTEVHLSAGRIEDAERSALAALERAEHAPGLDSLPLAAAIEQLGRVRLRLADGALEALQSFRRALELRERVLGPDHVEVAASLTFLGNLHFDLGDYASSIAMHRRALTIRQRSLGSDHPDVGVSLMRIGNALERSGDALAAVPLQERALAILERAHGPWHRAVARSLNNLALALMTSGRLAEARPLFERSVAIRDSLLGPGSQEAALSRLRLGLLLLRADEPVTAERVLREAVAANTRAMGVENPAGADAAIALAVASLRIGRDDQALAHALAAERATLEHLRQTALGLDETQALLYSASRSSGLQVALTLAAAHPQDTALVATVWDALARSRSVVLDELVARRRWAASTADTIAARLRAEMTRARDEFARIALQGDGDDAYVARVATALARKREADRALAEHSFTFRRGLSVAGAGLAEIRAALPANAALVSFAWSEMLPRGAAKDTSLGVVALVLPAGGAPRAVPLGATVPIDAAIRAWLTAVRRPPDALRRAHDERECVSRGDALRRLVWDPLAPLLKGAERVFVVPEMGLQLVPLAALPDGKGHVLAESGPLLHALAIERDLAQAGAGSEAERARRVGQGLLAIGGPTSSGRGAGSAAARRRAANTPGDPCTQLMARRFEPLPAAALEAREVAGAWDAASERAAAPEASRARVMLGVAATERALRDSAPGRRALHIAAHGFFVSERCVGVPGAVSRSGTHVIGHPLLRAGLVLAAEAGEAPGAAPSEDGILTAEEIAALDLEGLEWVVLSACETGLGEVDVNEGVFGLRRAFRIAGADAVVMSLWRVGDVDTREWMRALYRERFTRGLDSAAAARAATRAVLTERRSSGRSLHPYHWAGFVMEGGERTGSRQPPTAASRDSSSSTR